MNLTDVLKKPMITEKALNQSVLGKYIFAVDKRATKKMISQAVHQAFGVEVMAVKTINLKGKTRRLGRRRKSIQLSNWKKAIVQLAPGQKIDVFTVPGEAEEKPVKGKKPSSAHADGGASEGKKEERK
jgi:large subunit ribosomal protein L23